MTAKWERALDDGTWIAWLDMSFEPAARLSGFRPRPDPEWRAPGQIPESAGRSVGLAVVEHQPADMHAVHDNHEAGDRGDGRR
jgi:hypothetical protein